MEPTTTTTMATAKGKIKEAMGNSGNNHMRSLASALSAFDMHALSPGTLSPVFSPVLCLPLLVSALALPRTPQPMLPSALSSSFFFTLTGPPFPPASLNKLAVGVAGHPPGKQSVSLGRVPVAGNDVGGSGISGGGGANGNGNGIGNVPRWNSLGDLKGGLVRRRLGYEGI